MIPLHHTARRTPVPPPVPRAVTEWLLESAATRAADQPADIDDATRWARAFGLLDDDGNLHGPALVAMQHTTHPAPGRSHP